MKKYSLIISHTGNDKYAIVFKKWILIDGLESNVENLSKSDITFIQAIEEQNKFIE